MLRVAKRRVCVPIAVCFMALAPSASAAPGDIATLAGMGLAGYGGDSGLAKLAQLNAATGVAPLPDGGLLIADYKNNRVRRVSSTGGISTVAGTGTAGIAGDGGPATAAQLAAPVSVVVLADGSFLIADSAANRIRKVSSAGLITTIAGTVTAGSLGDGGPATSAQLNGPTDVRPTADGGFLIADYKNNRIRKVSSTGVISTAAGTGAPGFSGDGGSATAAQVNAPIGVAPLADGGFLIADSGNDRIRRVSSTGVISTVAGTGIAGFAGDGGAASAAQLNAPSAVQPTGDGGYVIADMTNNRVRAVAADGTIATIAGNGLSAFGGDGGPATAAGLYAPVGVAVAADGAILIADSGNNRVRAIEPAPAPPTTAPPTDPTPPAGAEPGPTTEERSGPISARITNPIVELAKVALVLPRGGVTVTPSGVVPLAIGCPADTPAACRGTVTLVTSYRSARASIAKRRVLVIGSGKFAVKRGKRATVRVRLSRRGRQMLSKTGSLKVTAKISRRGGPNLGEKSQTTSFKIKKGKSRRGKKASAGGIR